MSERLVLKCSCQSGSPSLGGDVVKEQGRLGLRKASRHTTCCEPGVKVKTFFAKKACYGQRPR
eukprot:SAG31_NODE_33495_length_343_cov_0.782787_1_plen_62_part_01